MRFFTGVASTFVLLIWVLSTSASDITDALIESIPHGLQEWSRQTDSKHTEASGVKVVGIYSIPDENRLFIIEVDIGSQIVVSNATTWNTQLSTAEVVEIRGVQYMVGSDGLTGLIDGNILVRAYAPNTDERDAIINHLDGLDVDALRAQAAQIQ
jgi:hypothetical protein